MKFPRTPLSSLNKKLNVIRYCGPIEYIPPIHDRQIAVQRVYEDLPEQNEQSIQTTVQLYFYTNINLKHTSSFEQCQNSAFSSIRLNRSNL